MNIKNPLDDDKKVKTVYILGALASIIALWLVYRRYAANASAAQTFSSTQPTTTGTDTATGTGTSTNPLANLLSANLSFGYNRNEAQQDNSENTTILANSGSKSGGGGVSILGLGSASGQGTSVSSTSNAYQGSLNQDASNNDIFSFNSTITGATASELDQLLAFAGSEAGTYEQQLNGVLATNAQITNDLNSATNQHLAIGLNGTSTSSTATTVQQVVPNG